MDLLVFYCKSTSLSGIQIKRNVNGIAMRLSNSLNKIYLMTIKMIDDFILDRAPIFLYFISCF